MQDISIYIHWPFCLSLCPYCDFNSHILNSVDHLYWLESYKKEIEHFKGKITKRKVKSIFFGGGTPSLMAPGVIEGIIAKIASLAQIDSNTEITLEANPTSYEVQKFKEFKAAGINRVSIGVQSLNDDSLKALGRKHGAYAAIKAIESAGEIFDRYSFDLIYALPEQTLSQWKKELSEALKLCTNHISLYQLTIEKATPFFNRYREGNLILPSNDVAADMYDWTYEALQLVSLNRYEISNYAKTGEECVHNLCYWNYDEYLGIGPGAHSRLHQQNHIEAIMMTHRPEKWLEQVKNNSHGIQSSLKLAKNEVIEEAFMMGMRLAAGINKANFHKKTKYPISAVTNYAIIEQYIKQGLIENDDESIKFTSKGLLLHSYLVPRILDIDN